MTKKQFKLNYVHDYDYWALYSYREEEALANSQNEAEREVEQLNLYVETQTIALATTYLIEKKVAMNLVLNEIRETRTFSRLVIKNQF